LEETQRVDEFNIWPGIRRAISPSIVIKSVEVYVAGEERNRVRIMFKQSTLRIKVAGVPEIIVIEKRYQISLGSLY